MGAYCGTLPVFFDN